MKAVTLNERFELNNQIAQANRRDFDAAGLDRDQRGRTGGLRKNVGD